MKNFIVKTVLNDYLNQIKKSFKISGLKKILKNSRKVLRLQKIK